MAPQLLHASIWNKQPAATDLHDDSPETNILMFGDSVGLEAKDVKMDICRVVSKTYRARCSSLPTCFSTRTQDLVYGRQVRMTKR